MTERPIKNIIFDFGGVVVNYDPQGYLESLFPDAGTVNYIMEHLFESEYWRLFDEDRADRAACNEVILKKAREDGFGPQMELVQARWPEHMRTKDDTVALVKALRAGGYNVYYLTNMPRDLWQEFVGRGLRDLFLDGVASFELRVTKPDRRIYEALFARAGIDPAESVFLDDMERNLRGAEAVGLRTALFTDAGAAREALAALGVRTDD